MVKNAYYTQLSIVQWSIRSDLGNIIDQSDVNEVFCREMLNSLMTQGNNFIDFLSFK